MTAAVIEQAPLLGDHAASLSDDDYFPEVASFDAAVSSGFANVPVSPSSLLTSPVSSSRPTVTSPVAGPSGVHTPRTSPVAGPVVNPSITSPVAEPGVETAPNSTSPVIVRRGRQVRRPVDNDTRIRAMLGLQGSKQKRRAEEEDGLASLTLPVNKRRAGAQRTTKVLHRFASTPKPFVKKPDEEKCRS